MIGETGRTRLTWLGREQGAAWGAFGMRPSGWLEHGGWLPRPSSPCASARPVSSCVFAPWPDGFETRSWPEKHLQRLYDWLKIYGCCVLLSNLSFREVQALSQLGLSANGDVPAVVKLFLQLQPLVVAVNHPVLVFCPCSTWNKIFKNDLLKKLNASIAKKN